MWSTCPPPRPRGCGNSRRGGGRKNDRIDAAAAACVAALQGDARPLEPEGHADAIALLDERRVNLAQSRVRVVNQLHALLRALVAGGAPRVNRPDLSGGSVRRYGQAEASLASGRGLPGRLSAVR